MRPVSKQFELSQAFGSMATAGVAPNPDPDSGVGYYVHLYGNYQPFGHAGEDIACPVGTPVYAMAPGTVLWADWGTNLPGDESEWGYRQRWYLYKGFPGIVTVIQHPGWIGVYAHLSNNDAAPRGTKVKEGQLIGYSGNTGGVAPHLHREALVDLNYTTGGDMIYGRVNPARFDGTGGAAIAPQGTTITPIILEEYDLTTEQYNDLRAILVENQARITAARDAANLAVRISTENQKRITTTREVVKQVAAKTGTAVDYAKIDEIVDTSLAAGVDVKITVQGKEVA